MLKPKFATKKEFFKYRCPLPISSRNLAADAGWHVFWSDCFLVFYFISQLLKTGVFTHVFALVSPPTQIFFHASSISITKFVCHILPLLDKDIQMKAVSFGLSRPISTHVFLPVPPRMLFPMLLGSHVWV